MLDYFDQVAELKIQGPPNQSLDFMIPVTVAHELGHLFGIHLHTQGTLVADWDGNEYPLDSAQISIIRASQELSSH